MKKYNKLFIMILLTIKLSIEGENLIKEKLLLNKMKFHYNFNNIRFLNTSDTTNNTNYTNNTYMYQPKKSNGLSTGGIIAILIPCILALIAAIALVLYCTCFKTPNVNPALAPVTTPPIPVIESSMEQFQSQPINQNLEQKVIVQPPPPQSQPQMVEVVHPPMQVYKEPPKMQVYKEAPSVPKLNRVFEPLYPVQKKVIPVQQIVEVKQISPQISQVQQVVSSPNISQVQVISSSKKSQVPVVQSPQISQIKQIIQQEPEPKITQSFVSVSESKTLPDISTSQISASKVLPLEVLPNIKTSSQVLPVKILPPIDATNQEFPENNIYIPELNQTNGKIIVNNHKNLPHKSQISEEIPVLSNQSSVINPPNYNNQG